MKILVVDDDEDVATSMAMLLQLHGYTVSVCLRAMEGLAEAERFRPDAILHDIAMSELDGYEVVRRLRRHAVFEHTLMIAITGYDTPEDRHRAKEAGFDAVLAKPADWNVVQKLLKEREALL